VSFTRQLRKAGYYVVEVWECEVDSLLKDDTLLAAEFDSHTENLHEPLNLANAFYGGRVEVFRTHAKLSAADRNAGWRLRYMDVTSLYPYICKTATYGRGHPVQYAGSLEALTADDLAALHGVAEVTILAPDHLDVPVLPTRTTSGMLVFSLCGKCLKEEKLDACSHTEREREIRGTWATPEISHAISNGYQIVKVHDLWYWEQVLDAKVDSVFQGYVNAFLKLKTEASGEFCYF